MSRDEKPPIRLKHAHSGPLSDLVRDVAPEQPLSDIALTRVHRRVLAQRQPRRTWRLAGLRAGVVASLLLLGASMGAAAVVSVRWFKPERSAAPIDDVQSVAPRAKSPRHSRATPRPTTLPVAEVAPAEAPPSAAPVAPAPMPVLPPSPARAARVAATARATSPQYTAPVEPQVAVRAVDSPLEEEAALMSLALRDLRQGHRSEAIATLRSYLQSHPAGGFRDEAHVALVTALVQSGQREEAKNLLGGESFAPHGSPAMSLLRAELIFPEQCVAAASLFADVLASTRVAALRERALYGAAMAQWQCGNQSRATADMKAFLEQFPFSPRAKNVREHLRQAPGGGAPEQP